MSAACSFGAGLLQLITAVLVGTPGAGAGVCNPPLRASSSDSHPTHHLAACQAHSMPQTSMLMPSPATHNWDNYSMHTAVQCCSTTIPLLGCLKLYTSLHGPQLHKLA